MNLDAYLARIGYHGPRAATLPVLSELTAAHTASIPFENMDVLLRVPISLELSSLEAKLVLRGRGGYCFEQNTMFAAVLQAFGFDVRGLAARVLWRAAGNAPLGARTHMLLRVSIADQAWLVDVGFGFTPTAPLAMVSEREQRTPHDLYRLTSGANGTELQVMDGTSWRPMYRISSEMQEAADYAMANFYMANAPESPFRRHLMMARASSQARHTLLDNQYTVRDIGGGLYQERIDSPSRLREIIAGPLGCSVPDGEGFTQLLSQVCDQQCLM